MDWAVPLVVYLDAEILKVGSPLSTGEKSPLRVLTLDRKSARFSVSVIAFDNRLEVVLEEAYKVLAMRRPRILTGWRLWTSVGLATVVLFLVVFSLAKISSPHDSRWDISWSALGWTAAAATAFVLLWTFLESGRKG